ncbi:Hypothetical protein CINCED_3A011987 [Cinara cedri]|uniref:Uncharacterized protein n=1 Tax=Cinara cedri TaxID=506608 RepID=A0A5E4MSI5_9HEMI|nr:Hypothetical protein CINCED_3A011987 [Cinara cedri]
MNSDKKTDDCKCYGTDKCDAKAGEPKTPPKKQCCPCPCPVEKCSVTLRAVEQLVEAENKDIELAELLNGITVLDEHRPKSNIVNHYDATSKSTRVDPEKSVDPEYLAFMMKSIQNGLSMKSDPIEMYEHLFSRGNMDAPLVSLGPAAAMSNENLIVPLSSPTVVNVLDPELEKGARLDTIMPRINVAVGEAPKIDAADDLRVLLGGSPADGQPFSVAGDNVPESREMALETREPLQSTAVLRGSTPPEWFPGYNVALPNTGHPAKQTDPETVLEQAWVHSQPLSLNLESKSAKLIGS